MLVLVNAEPLDLRLRIAVYPEHHRSLATLATRLKEVFIGRLASAHPHLPGASWAEAALDEVVDGLGTMWTKHYARLFPAAREGS